jgi:glyoxylase-like metal-dependent hydrolase (beta-lactamase superfamily II)
VVATALWGCGRDADAPPTDEGGQRNDTPAADASLATADPAARGYGEDEFPRTKELAPGVYSYEQLRSAGDERFTTVSLIVVTDEGVLVADGQGNLEETARLVSTVADLTDEPIRHVVISSDHGDHTGGNAAFPEDVEIWAHPTSAATLAAAAEARDPASDAPAIPLPTRLVENRETLVLGGRRIELLFLGRAHTGGDLLVHLPAEGVLFMSETFLHRIFPAMRSAYPSEWVEMLRAAEAMPVETYVPGHGFVDDPVTLARELTIFRQAVERVVAEGRRLHQAGIALEDAMTEAEFGPLESWSLRSSQGPRAIQQVYAELNGELRSPQR